MQEYVLLVSSSSSFNKFRNSSVSRHAVVDLEEPPRSLTYFNALLTLSATAYFMYTDPRGEGANLTPHLFSETTQLNHKKTIEAIVTRAQES